MPELPEVETIRRVLEPQLVGLIINDVTINNSQVIAYPSAEEFSIHLTGQVVTGTARNGKFLTLLFQSGDKLTLHLRMTGCLLVTPASYPKEKHTHLVFSLSDGNELRFEDMRRFGRFWLIKNGELDTYSGINKLGIEPFDKKLTAEYLQKAYGKRKKAIKECLLDQGVVCGIGNIYSDEILFASKIHPQRPASSLTVCEWKVLSEMIPKRLSYFIEKNAVTKEEYLKDKGKDYRNTPFLQVYGHEKEPCAVCKTPLEKCTVGGRSSVYCPNCQKREK